MLTTAPPCALSNYEDSQASIYTAGEELLSRSMFESLGQGTAPLTSAGKTLTIHSFFHSRNITEHLLYVSY